MAKVYDRQTKQVVEQVEYQEIWLKRLYESKWVRPLQVLVTQVWFSKLLTWRDYTPWSKSKIADFIEQYSLNLADYETSDYATFAAFFTRQLKSGKRPISPEGNVIAVADAKLSVYTISQESILSIKGQDYKLFDLLGNHDFSKLFIGGTACVYRLALEDYHRYVACETGKVLHQEKIKGKLHTVREIALKRVPVYKENQREYCLIDHRQVGPVLQMEVGALTVGSIHNFSGQFLYRGVEKGYFSLGGSTILVIYPANTLVIDEDIMEQSRLGIESQVRLGERVGSHHVK